MKTLMVGDTPVLVDDEDYYAVSGYVWKIKDGIVLRRGDRTHLARWIAETDRDVQYLNGNTLDCRRANLKEIPRTGNARKRTGYRGVFFRQDVGKYQAKLHSGKQYYLGNYLTAEEAARAYDVKARELLGEAAQLNFPEEGELGWE